jgi:ankyrin repeat protein
MKLIGSGSVHIGAEWTKLQKMLQKGICDSSRLTIEIDIDADTKDTEIRLKRLKEICELFTSAQTLESQNPQSRLLHWAARGNHLYAMGELLKDPCCDVFAEDNKGKTAFDWAVSAEKTEAAELLKTSMEKKLKLSLIGLALRATTQYSDENKLCYKGNLVKQTPEKNNFFIPAVEKSPSCIEAISKFFFSSKTPSLESSLKTDDTKVLLAVDIAEKYAAVSRLFAKKPEPIELPLSSGPGFTCSVQ